MSIKRKEFLKKMCVSSACLCGFSSIVYSKGTDDVSNQAQQEDDKNSNLRKKWISTTLQAFNLELDKESVRKVIKRTSFVHYEDLKMDDLLAEYQGDLKKFIAFLQDKWGWKVNYDKEKRVLIADENKNYCVCPIAADFDKETDSMAICYCSEGFAEKMFSKVIQTNVKAEVISSIRRGDSSCKYKITF
jgi:hypothetical protein